jgi:hypothetical protein
MNLLETMLSAGDGSIVKQLAGQFGINSAQATSLVSTLLPALAGGLKERLGQGDSSGLLGLIGGGNLTKFADNPSSLATPGALEQGKSLVSSIFGSADLTHFVSTVAEKAGVSSSVVTSMLPIAATLLGGLLSKSTTGGSSLTDAVDQVASAGHSGILGAVKSIAAKVFTRTDEAA